MDCESNRKVFSLVRADGPPRMLEHLVEGTSSWVRESIRPRDWLLELAPSELSEITIMAASMRAAPLPLSLLHPGQFRLQACRMLMERVGQIVKDGIGIAILSALPMDELAMDEAIAIYWVLGCFLSRPVATKWDGTMMYHVTDSLKAFGYGVRGSATNRQLSFHTDNAFGVALPDYVGLLCVCPAVSGGLSRVCSLYAVHNEMLCKHRGLLSRLYEPAYFDRQGEHAPGQAKILWAPLFQYDGNQLSSRLTPGLIRRGYEMMETPMDGALTDALECLEEILSRQDMWFEFGLRRGQMQFINNRVCGHYRSAFVDGNDPSRKRHLLRVWYRDTGARTYDG